MALRRRGSSDDFDDQVGHVHFDFELDKVHERVELNVAVGQESVVSGEDGACLEGSSTHMNVDWVGRDMMPTRMIYWAVSQSDAVISAQY